MGQPFDLAAVPPNCEQPIDRFFSDHDINERVHKEFFVGAAGSGGWSLMLLRPRGLTFADSRLTSMPLRYKQVPLDGMSQLLPLRST